MRSMAMIGLAVLSAAPAAGQHRLSDTRPLEPGGNFKVHALAGSVQLRGWDRDSVRVEGTLDDAARRGFYFGASGASGKLGIEGDGEAKLIVTLPRGTTVWIKTAGGEIAVSGMEGGLDLYSVTGSVRVEGSPRSLYAESMAGAIRVRGSPRTIRAKSGSGAIEVLGGGTDVDLSSVSGSVTVVAEAPLRRATLETVGGRVLLTGALDRRGVVNIRSHDGPVELALPRDGDADFLLGTLEGSLTNQLTRGAVRKSSGLKGRELTFTSGRGGAEVTVRTFSGAVTVRALEAT